MIDAKVVRIVDGDTVEIEARFKARLDFIDAPETRGNPLEKAAGLKTKEWLANRLGNQEVQIDIKKFDMYNRALIVIYKEGVNINGEMVKNKLAEIYAPNLHNNGTLD